MSGHGDVVKAMAEMNPSDERFNMNEDYDRSTYLTKVRRVPGREFQSYPKRVTTINNFVGVTPAPKKDDPYHTQPFYDVTQKTKLLERTDRSCMKFDGYATRSSDASIYRDW